MKKSAFEGVYVVAKFFLSKAPDGSVNCISRTLGKFSIIDKAFQGKVENKEVWVCRIIREIKPGQNQGAFILLPVEKVVDPQAQIRKLIPGFYDSETVEGAALITPNTEPSEFWMLSKATRQIFSKKYYAVIIPIAFNEDSTGHI